MSQNNGITITVIVAGGPRRITLEKADATVRDLFDQMELTTGEYTVRDSSGPLTPESPVHEGQTLFAGKEGGNG